MLVQLIQLHHYFLHSHFLTHYLVSQLLLLAFFDVRVLGFSGVDKVSEVQHELVKILYSLGNQLVFISSFLNGVSTDLSPSSFCI